MPRHTNCDDTVCQVCWQGTDEAKLLLCDGCDCGFHTFCIGEKAIPKGKWQCSRCKPRSAGQRPPLAPTNQWLHDALQKGYVVQLLPKHLVQDRLKVTTTTTTRHEYSFFRFVLYVSFAIALGIVMGTMFLEHRQDITEYVNDLQIPQWWDYGWERYYYSRMQFWLWWEGHPYSPLRKTDPSGNVSLAS